MGKVFLIIIENAVYNDLLINLIGFPINCVIVSDYAITNPTYAFLASTESVINRKIIMSYAPKTFFLQISRSSIQIVKKKS